MKKAIALVMILAVTATTLFASPVSVIGSVNASSAEVTLAGMPAQTNAFGSADDLFAGVQAIALTPEEAQDVEGEGVGTGFILAGVAGLLGAGIGAVYGFFSNFQYGQAATFAGMKTSAGAGFIFGGGLGFLVGLCF
jgi:hypothetical protein